MIKKKSTPCYIVVNIQKPKMKRKISKTAGGGERDQTNADCSAEQWRPEDNGVIIKLLREKN